MMRRLILIFLFFILPGSLWAGRPVPLADAFQLSAQPLNETTVQLHWSIKPALFLYAERIQVRSDALKLGHIVYPEPQVKGTPHGQLFVYRDTLTLNIPIIAKAPGKFVLNIGFQGCADQGFCYPPVTKELLLEISPQRTIYDVHFKDQVMVKKDLKDDRVREKIPLQSFKDLFSSGNAWLTVISFFGFGLLLAFTPCVLPMIPVLSGMIVGHGDSITTRKALLLSLCYVLSMSVTYSVVGGVIALVGRNLQVYMQSPIAIVAFSLLFVLLALSMFGLYDLRMPLRWQNKLAAVTRHQSGGHYLTAALMGCLSILILSPCVTPPLLGALSYIAETGHFGLGLLSLFFLGLGMGTPLLLVGASAGKLLPKAGRWMNVVKCLFGVLLLAVAIYLLSRLLPAFYTMLLWALLCIFSGVACKPFVNQGLFRQGLGIGLLLYGVLILYGASAGHQDPLMPLKPANRVDVDKVRVNTLLSAKTYLQQAQKEGQAVLVDFYADWCQSCKIMADSTFKNPDVIARLKDMLWLEVDLTPNNQDSHQLLAYFDVIAPPTLLFYDNKGHARQSLKLVGEVSPEVLIAQLNNITIP